MNTNAIELPQTPDSVTGQVATLWAIAPALQIVTILLLAVLEPSVFAACPVPTAPSNLTDLEVAVPTSGRFDGWRWTSGILGEVVLFEGWAEDVTTPDLDVIDNDTRVRISGRYYHNIVVVRHQAATPTASYSGLSRCGKYTLAIRNYTDCDDPWRVMRFTTVGGSLSISTQPSDQAVCPGAGVTLSVVAGGTAPLAYQWHKGSIVLPGATGTSYSIFSPQPGDSGIYWVKIVNACGTIVESRRANLTVADRAAPTIALAGENPMYVECHAPFSDPCATAIDNCAGSWTVCGTGGIDVNRPGTYTLSYVATDPSGNSSAPVSRNVIVRDTKAPTVTLNGSNPIILECQPAFIDPGATANDDCAGSLSVTVTGIVNPNVPATYTLNYCATDPSGNRGCTTRTVIVREPRPPLVSISVSPSYRVCVGSPLTFCAEASGTPPFFYQWFGGGIQIPGATSSCFTVSSARMSDMGSYTVQVRSSCGPASAYAPRFEVQGAPFIVVQPNDATVCAGETVTFCSVPNADSGPGIYQWFKGTVPLPGSNDVCLRIASVKSEDAGEYWLRVADPCGATESRRAILTVVSAPAVELKPWNPTICDGSSPTFCATVTGTPPFSYQWYWNDNEIAGATSNCVTLPPLHEWAPGSVRVRVQNSCGSVLSTPSWPRILARPRIQAQPEDATVPTGEEARFFALENIDSVPILTRQWYRGGLPIPGQTGPWLTIASVRAEDDGEYWLRLENACGVSESRRARLTVNSPGGSVSGWVWGDWNYNGLKETLVTGDRPDVVLVLDVSDSMRNPFAGTAVGEVNGDGTRDTILDAEAAAARQLMGYLNSTGRGSNCRVSLVTFSSSGTVIDLAPTEGGRTHTYAGEGSGYNGSADLDSALRRLRASGSSDYRAGLAAAAGVLNSLGTTAGNGNVIFISDGKPNAGLNFLNEVNALRQRGVNVRAFTTGTNGNVSIMRSIDPGQQMFTWPEQLAEFYRLPEYYLESGLCGVRVYLDANENGGFDAGERYVLTDATGRYEFTNAPAGLHRVRQEGLPQYEQTFPALGESHLVTVNVGQNTSEVNFGLGPRITLRIQQLSTNRALLTMVAEPGWVYRLESTRDWQSWNPVTNILASDWDNLLAVAIRRVPPMEFFRAQRFEQTHNGMMAAPVPTVSSVNAGLPGSVALAWTNPTTNEGGFRIERSTDGVFFNYYAGSSDDLTQFTDTNVEPGKRYWYRLSFAGMSYPYAVVCVETAPLPNGGIIHVDLAAAGPLFDESEAAPFRSVTAAHAAAVGRETIRVRPGTYAEKLLITKPVRVESSGGLVRIGL